MGKPNNNTKSLPQMQKPTRHRKMRDAEKTSMALESLILRLEDSGRLGQIAENIKRNEALPDAYKAYLVKVISDKMGYLKK